MSSVSRVTALADLRPFPIITEGLPLLHEDDEEGDMGESDIHSTTEGIAFYGIKAHVAGRPELQVCSNLNLYYSEKDPTAYVSPDLMVMAPFEVKDGLSSYRLGADGPAPLLVGEVLSERTAQQEDLGRKPRVYAQLGIREYLLIDVTGHYLRERLLLKRLLRNRTWKDEQDPDGGVTSRLGFRAVLDIDGRLRIIDAVTGRKYTRPDEAEVRIRSLEEELARLKAKGHKKRKGS